MIRENEVACFLSNKMTDTGRPFFPPHREEADDKEEQSCTIHYFVLAYDKYLKSRLPKLYVIEFAAKC